VDTAGYKGWKELKFFEGKDVFGRPQTTDGFRSVVTNEEVYDSEPPYPTGDMGHIRHSSDTYRRNFEQIKWER
jgi:hypothetical protein